MYTDKDISRLRFIRRAQTMKFSLTEMGELLQFREDPTGAKALVRQMALKKLSAIEKQIEDLRTLRNELRPLVSLCAQSKDNCPIIEGIDRYKAHEGLGTQAFLSYVEHPNRVHHR